MMLLISFLVCLGPSSPKRNLNAETFLTSNISGPSTEHHFLVKPRPLRHESLEMKGPGAVLKTMNLGNSDPN